MRKLAHIVKNLEDANAPIEHQWVDPAPFPQGKHGYPTRIAYSVVFQGRKPLCYTGKPTRQAVSIVYDAMRRRDCTSVLLMEFDRKNLVAEHFHPGRSNGLTPMTGGNTALLHVYHPFDSQGGTVLIPYFLNKFFLKRLTTGNQKYTYYSPLERLKIKDHIDPFRLWITEQRRLPVQPKEAPKKPTLKNYYEQFAGQPFFNVPVREFEP